MEQKSLLGDIAREVFRFIYQGNYDAACRISSPTNAYEQVPAKEFFYKIGSYGNTLIVNPARLPLDPDIKAIIARKSDILVETEKLDFGRLEQALAEDKVPVELKGKSINYNERRIITTRTQNTSRYPRINVRTLSTIPYAGEEDTELACQVLDSMYNHTCFAQASEVAKKAEEIRNTQSSPALPGKMNLRLNQEMQMLIEQTQTPILALQMRQNMKLLIARSNVLRMSGRQLEAHVQKEIETNPALNPEQ
jgi:hypothetical protein